MSRTSQITTSTPEPMEPPAGQPSPWPPSRNEFLGGAQRTVPPGSVGGTTAVVIGGGLAGTLAAWALRDLVDSIVVLERDRYPSEPAFRAGIPQSRHAHLLLPQGHYTLERMLPGIRTELIDLGASMVSMGRELRWLSSAGWMATHNRDLAILSCSRGLLDHTVRDRVRRHPHIEFHDGLEVIGLTGTPSAATGVKVSERGKGRAAFEIAADLVVVASGRSRTDKSGRSHGITRWLAELGCAPAPEQRIDAGVAYTSRIFERPAHQLDFKALYVQTAGPAHPHTGSVLPIEGDRFLATLGGMRGAEPGPGNDGFQALLARLRDPCIAELLATAEPVGPAHGFLPGASVRRDFRRAAPDNLVVLADAGCSLNPVYGQGMTIASLGVHALRNALLHHGSIGPAAARAAQRGIFKVSTPAWLMAAAEDLRFPQTVAPAWMKIARAQHIFADRLLALATQDPNAAVAFQEVMSMVAPLSTLARPAVLRSVLTGGRR